MKRSLFSELKRRNVWRAAALYAAAAWLLVQVATQVFPFFGVPDWAVRALVVALLLGFPFWVAFAWLYELTPEGLRREREVAPGESIAPRTGRKLDLAIIGVLSVAVVLLLANTFIWHEGVGPNASASGAGAVEGGSTRAPAKSIAVLPFVNGSGDPKNQYFSDGLSEALIGALSHISGLKVIDRESSFQFRGKDIGSQAIGKALGVGHLVEGSVTREGDEVRLRAQLVSAADGSTLWSQTYDRAYQHLFALQDDLTKAVATALEARLLPGAAAVAAQTDRPPSGSLPAYNAYLEGNFYSQQLTETGFRQAIEAYRKAVELDPRYATAWARLSSMWSDLGAEFFGGARLSRALDSGWVAVDSALALDPDLALAHLARGQLLLRDSLDWRGGEAALKKAVELAPADATAKRELARVLAVLGRTDEAVGIQSQLVASDPLDALGYARLVEFDLGLRRFDDALRASRRALELEPTAWQFHSQLAEIEVLRGDTADALRAAAREPAPQWRVWALALAREAAGDTAGAQAALRAMIAKFADMAAYQIAEVYASWGDPARAFAWLDRAWKQRDPGLSLLLYDPFLRRYRHDARFAALCRRVGLPVPGNEKSGSGSDSRS